MKKTFLLIGFYLITISTFCKCNGNSQTENNQSLTQTTQPDPAPIPEAPIDITAPQLYREYDNNQIAVNEKYKNKTLIITGVISMIGKTNNGVMFVALKGVGEYGGVECGFSNDYISQIAKLNTGQQVRIKGTYVGGNNIIIGIDGCSLQ